LSRKNVLIGSNMVVTQRHYSEEAALELAVRQHVKEKARKTRRDWAKTLLGNSFESPKTIVKPLV
jgi:hypothetical protein